MVEKTKVGISISAIGQMPINFVGSLTGVITTSMSNNIEIVPLINIDKPLDMSRHRCTQQLLDKGVDYIFYMDTDMTFKPDSLLELLKQERDIITGVYCYQAPPFGPVLKMHGEGKETLDMLWDYPREKLFTVDFCGAGCLLVKREVFEKVEKPWFKFIHGRLTEDFYFCKKARDAGYKIWVNGKVECGHMSEAVPVVPENFWRNKESLKKKFADLGKKANVELVDYKGESEEVKK